MEYYIEYVFLENFIIDFILLYITGSLLKKKIYLRRIITASIIGAVYVILILFFKKAFISYFIVKVSVSLLMIVISYSPSGIIDYCRVLLCFYIVTLLMVGIMGALYYLVGSKATSNIIMLSLLLVSLILKLFFYEVKKRRENEEYIRIVTIEINNQKKVLKAYVDTGNELKDPLTGNPVIIVNIDSIKGILGEDITKEIKEFYESGGKNYVNLFLDRYEELRLRVLRYNTISNKGELMMCIVPDNLEITLKNKSVHKSEAVIGIYPYKLSESNDYEALLFKKMLDWESENEYKYC